MKKHFILHPVLFALLPVLTAYFHNMDQLRPAQITQPAALTVLFAAALVALVTLITRNYYKAVLLVSPFLVLFLSYGYIYSYIGHLMARTPWYLIVTAFSALSLALLLAFTWFCRIILKTEQISTISSLNRVFNLVAMLLVGFNLVQIGAASFFGSGVNKITKPNCTPAAGMFSAKKPDIYYILLDGYAGLDQIKTVYNYDNSPFVAKLVEKGFYVAKKSESKFIYTALSLTSSLNMEHAKDMEKNDPRLLALVRNNKISQLLKCQGYKYITFGSWYHTTGYNPYADHHFNTFGFRFTNDLTSLLVRSSAVSLLFIDRDYHRRSILAVFDELPNIVPLEGPKFVWVHLLCPHEPLVFGPQGEKISFKDSTFSLRKSLYLGQFIFITKKIDRLIDQILSSSKEPPIIVIQSDHGIRSSDGSPNQIFNAYYLPGEGSKLLYESISPVNTFRLILNHYFNGRYDLLPD